jgi:hypothetical protein
VGKVPEIVERGLGVDRDLVQHRRGPVRIALDQLARQPRLDRERHQLLLRSVVDVALQPPSLLILGGDEALLRCLEVLQAGAELLGQPDVPQHETRLRGEVTNEALLGRIERVVRG